jgi:hypothetical protein
LREEFTNERLTFNDKLVIGSTLLVEEVQQQVKVSEASGKALDPNSGRQIVMKIIYDFGDKILPSQITAKLKEEGREVKYLHSHLNYFKSHGQLIHNEDKTYEISDKMMKRLDEMYS